MFLFQSAQKSAPEQQAQGAQAQSLIPFSKFTPQMKRWLGALELSANELKTLITERTKALRSNVVYFGPNSMDTSFFYRLMPGQTADNLAEYTQEEHFALKHHLPFVQRDVDCMKNSLIFATAPAETKAQRAEFLSAFKTPEFNRSIVSEQEFGLLGRLVYDSRQEGAQGKGIIFCIKHFPGESNIPLGITHNQETSSSLSLSDLYSGPMRPFIDIVSNSKAKPAMVMMGHVSYLGLKKSFGQSTLICHHCSRLIWMSLPPCLLTWCAGFCGRT